MLIYGIIKGIIGYQILILSSLPSFESRGELLGPSAEFSRVCGRIAFPCSSVIMTAYSIEYHQSLSFDFKDYL